MNLPVVTNQNCQFDIYQLPCSISQDYLQDQSRGEKVKMLIYREKKCSTIVKLPRPCYQKLVINISEKCILSLCIRSSSRISLTFQCTWRLESSKIGHFRPARKTPFHWWADSGPLSGQRLYVGSDAPSFHVRIQKFLSEGVQI